MKREYAIVSVLAFIAGTIWSPGAPAQNESHPGSEPYAPRKLEWIALQMNAICGKKGNATSMSYDVSFVPDFANDALIIDVSHGPRANRTEMIEYLNLMRDLTNMKAEQLGWDWLKVKEKVTQRK